MTGVNDKSRLTIKDKPARILYVEETDRLPIDFQ
jgi:hypothetical protein